MRILVTRKSSNGGKDNELFEISNTYRNDKNQLVLLCPDEGVSDIISEQSVSDTDFDIMLRNIMVDGWEDLSEGNTGLIFVDDEGDADDDEEDE